MTRDPITPGARGRRRSTMTRALAATLAASALIAATAAGGGDDEPRPLPAQRPAEGGGFTTSTTCALCHASSPRAEAMRDERDASVAPIDLWRSSMMASSSRDPLWRAVVSAEVAATPSREAEIESKCTRCHAPMAWRHAKAEGGSIGLAVVRRDDALGQLALDGASCTTCHRIAAAGLGEATTFSGHFPLDDGARIFGPHEAPFAMPMRHHTGYEPTRGDHIGRSALCATCHTLETEPFAADGTALPHRVLEQAPYLEWRNSVYDDERAEPGPDAASCQACHLPTTSEAGRPIETRIARNPGGRDFPPVRPRRPFGRHLLVGGNTLVPAILRDHADALRPPAPREALDETIRQTRAQLRERTAKVSIVEAARDGERLRVVVRVDSSTGHKLPSGIPVRRVWLRLRVADAGGEVLFASGAHDAEGRIVGPDGAPLASERAGGPIAPHRDRVAAGDEVQVWEAVMADANGAPTFRLMRAAGFAKDDRLLPRGWSRDHPDAARTAPVGTEGDASFAGGRDEVTYEVALPDGATGELGVEATLLYQSLSARFAAELFTADTPEVRAMRRFWEAATRAPELVDEARATVAPR